MRHEWLLEHRKTEADYWWFINKRRITLQLLGALTGETRGRLLEIGCGGGLFSALLQKRGWNVVSSDLFPDAARFAREQGVPAMLAFDANAGWPFHAQTFDAFVMLDVLEHLADDGAALREARRVLRLGAAGVISVPAYPFLFSAWDEYNRHYRRYTTRSLARVAEQAGFRVERATYWNAVSLPPAFVLRLRDRFRGTVLDHAEYPPVPPWLNRLLAASGRAESAWLRHAAIPCGLSAAVALRAV